MTVNLWFFLSMMAVAGVIFTMFMLYLGHKKNMKVLEIEASKAERESSMYNAI